MSITSKRINGLETIYINVPGNTFSSVQIWFRAGSSLESKEEMGIAHFLEHMFFKGTEKRPGPRLTSEVESFGGEINAFTSFDYTCYYINCPKDNIAQSVDILLDMTSNPMFLENELLTERDVVFEEYRRSQDNPGQYLFQQVQETSFVKNYSHPILGREQTIKNFSRTQLTNFREKYYNLTNAFLVIAGDLSEIENNEDKIIKHNIPKGAASTFTSFSLKNESLVSIHKKETNQTLINFAIESSPYDTEEGVYEDLALSCITMGETSFLYKSLVLDKTLASSVSGSTLFFKSGGVHFIRFGCPTDVKRTKEILDKVTANFKEFFKQDISSKDIEKIRNQYLASKVFERESLESYSFSIGHSYAQTSDLKSEEIFFSRVKKATTKNINDALRRLLTRPIQVHLQIAQDSDLKSFEKIGNHFLSGLKKLESNSSLNKTSSKEKVITSEYDKNATVYELNDGHKFLYRYSGLTPTFVLQTYIKSGQADETSENAGIHNLLSNLLSKEYEGVDHQSLKHDLEFKSASLTGFSGKNAYGLELHGLTEHFTSLTDHFFGCLLKPKFSKNFFNHEKELVKRGLKIIKEDPVKLCFMNFNQLIFNNHSYSQHILGTEKSIKKISKDSIEKLHKNNLQSKKIIFSYVGDLPVETVRSHLDPLIEKIIKKASKPKKEKKVSPLLGKKVKIKMPREQVHIVIGYPGFKISEKNDIYLKMLSSYLSGQSSPLFIEIRDKQGLCYTVQPIHLAALEAGYWGIYIGSGKDKYQQAITSIYSLINDLKVKGIDQNSFDKIKKMMEGQSLLNLQTIEDYASNYSILELHNLGLNKYYEWIQEIKNSKLNEFNKFLNSFFDQKTVEVLVGPI